MGLDTVELVMSFEEEFGIEIISADAEKLTTIGKTIDYIEKKISPADKSLLATAEKKSREEIDREVRRLHEDRVTRICASVCSIQPTKSMKLAEMFPVEMRIHDWANLEEEMGGWIPGLRRATWLRTIIFTISIGVALYTGISWGLKLIPFVSIALLLILFYATKRFKYHFPSKMDEFGDFVEETWKGAPRNSLERVKLAGFTRESIRTEVLAIVVDELGVTPEQCTDGAEYIKDLGVE